MLGRIYFHVRWSALVVTPIARRSGLELHECSQQNSGSWRRTIQSGLMKTTYVNIAIAALSMITAGAFGLLAPVTTPSGWFMLAAAATAPSLVFMHYFKRPAETMSESIREAIR